MAFEEKKMIPGPGAYDEHKELGHSVKISKKKRFKRKVSDVPGPGRYEQHGAGGKHHHKNENCGTYT